MQIGQAHSTRAADGTELYFETYGDRSKPAIFMGPHFYLSRTDEADTFGALAEPWIERLQQEFFLIIADYPRGIGRSGNPQGLAYSPDIAVQEYECIANAAGVGRFGWIGYSFGAAMGVQVACRSDRVSALAIGGFPPLNAPFGLMIDVATSQAKAPPPLPKYTHPGVLWSAASFWTALASWPERREISKLVMPRLVFMGDNDNPVVATREVPIAKILRAAENDLLALGWQVSWLNGHDHMTALGADVSLPIVHRFFRDALLG